MVLFNFFEFYFVTSGISTELLFCLSEECFSCIGDFWGKNRWNFRKFIKNVTFRNTFLDLNFYRVPMWTRSQIVYLTKSDLNLSLKPHLRLKKYSKNFTAKTKVAPNAIFGMKFDFRLKVCSKNTRSLMTTRALPRPSLTFKHSIWNFFSTIWPEVLK